MALSPVKTPLTVDGLYFPRLTVIQNQWKLINDWKPGYQMWPLRYGTGVLCLVAGGTGLYINTHFTKKFQVPIRLSIPSHVAIAAIPISTYYLLRDKLIIEKILLKNYSCPLCLEMKATLLHGCCSFVYPFLLCGFMHITYGLSSGLNMSSLRNPLNTWKYFSSVLKPLGPALSFLIFSQCIIAGSITHLEMESMLRIEKGLRAFYKKHMEEPVQEVDKLQE